MDHPWNKEAVVTSRPARRRLRLASAMMLTVAAGFALAGCGGIGGDSGYPAYDGTDLDCADIGREVDVSGADPHGLDADGDGVGCEGR